MKNGPIVVLVSYRAQPGREDVARREIHALIDTVRTEEPDCVGITMLQDPDDSGRILLYERWSDRETFLGAHIQTPHLQSFIQRAAEFLAAPPEISFWSSVAEASANR